MSKSRTAASHANVHELVAELGLSDAAYRRALEIAQLSPGKDEWLSYINHFLTAVGALLIVAGVTAFFAWNWADLSYMAKFALIQSGIVGTVVLAWRLGIDSVGGAAACLRVRSWWACCWPCSGRFTRQAPTRMGCFWAGPC